eukprot:6303618-Pyramimonas_sp.AAC.1
MCIRDSLGGFSGLRARNVHSGSPSERMAGIMNIQAKYWLSAETTAQPLPSQSMGSQEGALGRSEHRRRSE